jgi:hypothetical protein
MKITEGAQQRWASVRQREGTCHGVDDTGGEITWGRAWLRGGKGVRWALRGGMEWIWGEREEQQQQ